MEQNYRRLVEKHGPAGEPRNDFERWLATKNSGRVDTLLQTAEFATALIPVIGVPLTREIDKMRRRVTGDRPLQEKAEKQAAKEARPPEMRSDW